MFRRGSLTRLIWQKELITTINHKFRDLWSHFKRFLGRLRIISFFSLTQATESRKNERIGKYPHLSGYSYSFLAEKKEKEKIADQKQSKNLLEFYHVLRFYREILFLSALAKWLLDKIIFFQGSVTKKLLSAASCTIKYPWGTNPLGAAVFWKDTSTK